MITREQAKKLADEKIFGILLQTAFSPSTKGWGEVDALCYAFSALIMARAFQKANHTDDSFDIAVAAQGATLACAIDAGALSKQYIYDSYVNLVQEMAEETDEK
ncbi:hypothetical protein EFM17_00880 [Lactobacillus delbrueckii]|nr:hypothetical protein [Lactobacillus delbrueckii]